LVVPPTNPALPFALRLITKTYLEKIPAFPLAFSSAFFRILDSSLSIFPIELKYLPAGPAAQLLMYHDSAVTEKISEALM